MPVTEQFRDSVLLLAGAVAARGSMTLSRSRSAPSRFHPALYVEVPERVGFLDTHFGEPVVRHYFGRELFRYGTQDRMKIVEILALVCPFLPSGLARRADLLIGFCRNPGAVTFAAFEVGTATS